MLIISPYSRSLRNGKINPKNYPFWEQLIDLLHIENYNIVQVGINSEKRLNNTDDFLIDLSLKDLSKLILDSQTWISVDNFFHHYCTYLHKPGIVIFSQSDPNIFGHKQNINLLKDRKYLRPLQFDIWETTDYITDSFINPDTILGAINEFR